MKNYVLAIAATITLSGCMATMAPTKTARAAEPSIIDISGTKPVNPDAQAIAFIASDIQPYLKDPDSMKMDLIPSAFRKRICSNLYTGKKYRVWANAAYINAKNSYGGYTGNKGYLIYFKNGKPAAYKTVMGSLVLDGDYACPRGLI